MKDFFGAFILSLFACFLFLYFVLPFSGFFSLIVFAALVIATFITLIVKLATKVEELEARIKALEANGEIIQ